MLFLGYGGTISRSTLMNIMASGKNIPVFVLEFFYFQGYLSEGGKKYGSFICHQFLDHMKEIDPENKLSDIVMFDGSSNVQLGGKLLKVNYPKFTGMCGVEHIV